MQASHMEEQLSVRETCTTLQAGRAVEQDHSHIIFCARPSLRGFCQESGVSVNAFSSSITGVPAMFAYLRPIVGGAARPPQVVHVTG